jgi:hypothetical protein
MPLKEAIGNVQSTNFVVVYDGLQHMAFRTSQNEKNNNLHG